MKTLKLKRPGPGFIVLAAALVCSVTALCLFLTTYAVGGYKVSRWALTCTVLSIWLLALLCGNMLVKGDTPVWSGFVFALTAFLLTYGLLRFLQPCLSPIGFAFGASDLNMGDTALNKTVAYRSVVTAAFYLIGAVCTAVAAFLPASGRGKGSAVSAEEERA